MHRPPGAVVLTLAVTASVLLVCVYLDWWPLDRNMDAADHFVVGGVGAALGLAGAVGWLWHTAFLAVVDRRWSWRILLFPGVLIGGIAVAVLAPQPSFEDARPELERIALSMPAAPGSLREGDFTVAGIDFASVQRHGAHEILFRDADAFGLTSSHGWVYSPNGFPRGYDDFTAHHITGDWYEYTATWRD